MIRAKPRRTRKSGGMIRPPKKRDRRHGYVTKDVDTADSAFGGSKKNDEMTLKIARSNDTSRSAPETKTTQQSGWDPFEVWRTRVLLPRIAETNAPAPSPKNASTTVQLLPRKR